MKVLLMIAMTLAGSSAFANGTCNALGSYEGTYVLESKTCDGSFAGELTVERSKTYDHVPYMIRIGSMGIGPSVSENSSDRCSITPDAFIVETCTSDRSCLPQNWVFKFTSKQAIFERWGCRAVYVRE